MDADLVRVIQVFEHLVGEFVTLVQFTQVRWLEFLGGVITNG